MKILETTFLKGFSQKNLNVLKIPSKIHLKYVNQDQFLRDYDQLESHKKGFFKIFSWKGVCIYFNEFFYIKFS